MPQGMEPEHSPKRHIVIRSMCFDAKFTYVDKEDSMKLTLIRSTVVASGLLLGGSLVSAPVLAQSEATGSGQQAEDMLKKGKGKTDEAKGKGREKADEMRERSEEEMENRERAEEGADRAKGDAERERERLEEQERSRERSEEKAQEKGEGGNRDNENRQADPASKGSEQGQAKKQERSKAWWNFWSD